MFQLEKEVLTQKKPLTFSIQLMAIPVYYILYFVLNLFVCK